MQSNIASNQLRGCSYIVGCQGVLQIGGSGSGLSLKDPTKVKPRKSLLFTGGSLKVENKFTQSQKSYHIFNFILYNPCV